MNIDLLPFNAFALESCATAGPASNPARTLTLQLALGPVLPFHEPMSGTASIDRIVCQPAALRAVVLPACSDSLTITFG